MHNKPWERTKERKPSLFSIQFFFFEFSFSHFFESRYPNIFYSTAFSFYQNSLPFFTTFSSSTPCFHSERVIHFFHHFIQHFKIYFFEHSLFSIFINFFFLHFLEIEFIKQEYFFLNFKHVVKSINIKKETKKIFFFKFQIFLKYLFFLKIEIHEHPSY